MRYQIDFEKLRNELALKCPYPSKDRLDMEFRADMNANPHNDNYQNKKPRRGEAEIVSDISYAFADSFLLKQYTQEYQMWMQANTVDKWGAKIIDIQSRFRELS